MVRLAASISRNSASSSGWFRVPQHSDDGSLGNELVQQPQLLGRQISSGKDHAGDVAAGPTEAGDQACSDRIEAGGEDNCSLSSVNRKYQSELACKAALPVSRACSIMLKVVLALFG